jgi:uncharacterized protein YdeI (YjbR/CyaY-like superfamily)
MELKNGVKTFHAPSRNEWRSWLQENHAEEKSVWLIIYRKGSATPSVYYGEAVDEALCFGWIDSKAIKRDEESRYQFFSQRSVKSNWSKVNKEKVEKLTAEKLMMPAGLKMVAIAKEKGTWNALDNVDALIVPPDLEDALGKNKTALKHWENFAPSSRRGILEWIFNAKKPQTRQKRIDEAVRLAAENIKANYPIQ